MDTTHPTAGWEQLGDSFYRKVQLYTAVFDQSLDLDSYAVAGAPYAGAVALCRDETKIVAYRGGAAAKPSIEIYSSAGKPIRTIRWDKVSEIRGLGWSDDEKLLVVTKDGTVRCYVDLQDDFSQFSLGNGAEEYGVESCRYVPARHHSVFSCISSVFCILTVQISWLRLCSPSIQQHSHKCELLRRAAAQRPRVVPRWPRTRLDSRPAQPHPFSLRRGPDQHQSDNIRCGCCRVRGPLS